MFSIKRAWAIALRYLKPSFRHLGRIFTIIYWLTLNVIIWGSTSSWLQQLAHIPKLVTIIIAGFIFWQIVFRVNLETAKNLLDEITGKNLVNVFSTPVKLSDWIVANIIVGLIDAFCVIVLGGIIGWYFYNINFFDLGLSLLYSVLLLTMSGWFIGFLICSFLIYQGRKAQDLVYSIGYIFAPFSCIYYPLSSLNGFMKTISSFIPMTYVFENIRCVLNSGACNEFLLLKSLILNIIYLIISISLFSIMFKVSKKNSLANL